MVVERRRWRTREIEVRNEIENVEDVCDASARIKVFERGRIKGEVKP